MKKLWSIVTTLAAILLGLGIVCLLVGFFTGGSIDRIVNLVFGGPEGLQMLIDSVKTGIFNMF